MKGHGFFRRIIIAIVMIITALNGFALDTGQAGQKQEKRKLSGRNYAVSHATSQIKLDGVVNEKAWSDAVVIRLPYEWNPGDNIPAPVDTDCMVTFDANNLFIAFRCFDPEPSKIRAHLMDRDATDILIQDDHICIMVDPFNDERRGFQFRVNPLGVQADANFSEMEGYEDFSWDAIWNSGGKITDWGYSIEIAIPFNQLRFPKGAEVQTWGFSAERSYPRNVRHRMTSHKRRRDINCIFCQFNKITGFQGVKTGLNLEVDPTLMANRTDKMDEFPQGAMENGKVMADPGISVRWGVTPNMILNAAVNPDFSQIEADIAQLEVNTRFAIRYPEKRPFFLEGADFFLTPMEAVFTRTVADPAGGLKFTGKIGKNAIGFFGAVDSINNLLFPSNQGSFSTSLEEDVTSGVFRFRRDVGKNSALGFLYTGRAANGDDNYYNHVMGFDGFLRLSRTKTLSFQYLHSETDYPLHTASSYNQDIGAFGGDALKVDFNHMGRNWIYAVGYEDFSPGFRADYGYIPQVDMRSANGQIDRVFWGKRGSWFNRISVGFSGSVLYDYEGKLTDGTFMLNTLYVGPLQTTALIQISQGRQFYAGENYDLNSGVLFVEMKPMSGLRFNVTGVYGGTVDYQNERKANQFYLEPFAEFNLGRHINVNIMHTLQTLSLKRDKIFTANLSQVRLIYNFSVRTFIRAIVQYMDLSRNTDLYLFTVLPKTQTFFTQFLFSYKINPQTVLFLGYSDNYLGMTGIDVTQTDRTFFMKVGYAWTK